MFRAYEKTVDMERARSHKEEVNFYRIMVGFETKLKNTFITGVKGLKNVKTTKKIIMRPHNRDDLNTIDKRLY